MRSRTLVAALALVLTGTAVAQDTYTLKLFDEDTAGCRTERSKTETSNQSNVIADGAGNVLKEDKKVEEFSGTFQRTVVAVKDKKPTKVSVRFAKASQTTNGQAVALNVAERAIVAERDTGEFKFTADGAELGDADLTFLKKFVRVPDDEDVRTLILPAKAVAVGETWKCDAAGITRSLTKAMKGVTFGADKTTATGKLVKASKKGDATYGVIEVEIATPIADLGNPMLKVADGSTLKVTLAFDGCIDGTKGDGTGTVSMTITVKGTLTANGMDLGLKTDVSSKTVDTIKELPKK